MRRSGARLVAVLVCAVAGCGAPTAPTSAPPAPTPSVPTPPVTLNLTGTWIGVGTDAQGGEKFRWTVTHTGDRVSGDVTLEPSNATDGSCGSCHKQKAGTLEGTLTDGALRLTLDFPAGGKDITPLCSITMHASTTDVAAGRIAASYTGTTSCEGAITDGTLTVTR